MVRVTLQGIALRNLGSLSMFPTKTVDKLLLVFNLRAPSGAFAYEGEHDYQS